MSGVSLKSNAVSLKAWVKEKYRGRRIRISGELYFTHLTFVAEKVEASTAFGYEIGLCHDLLEDLRIPATKLYNMLLQFKYTDSDARFITDAVIELTDFYTAKAYPEMSKKERKKNEDERLSGISSVAQTVKYADLIYNINWTLKYEPKKAAKYLQGKQKLLGKLTAGKGCLRQEANHAVSAGLDQLN